MPYVVVLSGSWRYRDRTYSAGVHEVEDDVAEAAKAHPMGVQKVVVSEEEPRLVTRKDGPLTLEDIRVGTRAIRIQQPEPDAQPEAGPIEVPYDFSCPSCEASFPSAPARDRHIEFHH